VEALPELSSLSDSELKELIDKLMEEEQEVSYRRRILHGKIDILRAEYTARRKQALDEGRSLAEEVDMERLTTILSQKAAPPVPAEGE
jgi:hypothetical protein